MDFRSEMSRQLSAVHERMDDMSQRLEAILQLLVATAPQRRPSLYPAGNLAER